RGADHEPAVSDVVARRLLVKVLVGFHMTGALFFGEVRDIAPHAIPNAELDNSIRQHLFDAGPLDAPTRERVIGDQRRLLAQDDVDSVSSDIPPVENTKLCEMPRLTRSPMSVAEIVFSAGVQCDFGAHNRPMLSQ